MYVREIANDFVVSAWTVIASADRGVKWYADENRAMILWAGFREGNQELLTELSSVLFGGISCSLSGLGSSNIESFKKNISKKDPTSLLNNNNSCCNLCNS